MMGRLVAGFVLILIGVSLIPVITNQIDIAVETTNMTFGSTVIQLVPGFFVFALAAAGIAVAYGSFRRAGMFGGYDDEPSDEEVKKAREEYYPEPIVTPTKPKHYKETLPIKEERNHKPTFTEGKTKFDEAE